MKTLRDYQSEAANPMVAVKLPTSDSTARVYRAYKLDGMQAIWYCDGGFWGCSTHWNKGAAMARLQRLLRMEHKYTDLNGLINIRNQAIH